MLLLLCLACSKHLLFFIKPGFIVRGCSLRFFENLVEKDETFEIKGKGPIHRILEKSMQLFDEEWWLAQSNKSLRNFIQNEFAKKDKKKEGLRPDFVCVDVENKFVFVELKRPSHSINKKDIGQLEQYLLLGGHVAGKKINRDARALLKRRTGMEFLPFSELIQKLKSGIRNT